MKLLIVDDSEEMRREIRSMVADIASEIYECSSGPEAVTMYPVLHPDWVFMDIVMEPMDGLEATRLLISYFPEARIVIVTSYDDEYLRDAAHAAGACGYVMKDNLLELRRMLLAQTPDSGGQDRG